MQLHGVTEVQDPGRGPDGQRHEGNQDGRAAHGLQWADDHVVLRHEQEQDDQQRQDCASVPGREGEHTDDRPEDQQGCDGGARRAVP